MTVRPPSGDLPLRLLSRGHRVRIAGLLWAVAPLVAGTSCQNPGLRETAKPLAPSAEIAPILNPKRLSSQSAAALREVEISGIRRSDPVETVRRLDRAISDDDPLDPRRIALAELLCHEAASLKASDPGAAIGWFLTAAQVTCQGAIESHASREPDGLIALYNHACGQAAMLAFSLDRPGGRTLAVEGPLRKYALDFRPAGANRFDPAWFDELKAAEFLKVRGYQEREFEPGLGGALVGHRSHTPERAARDPLLPEVGMALPVTATLSFSGDGGAAVELALHDVLLTDRAGLGSREVKLAADYTVALALLSSLEPSRRVGRKAMLQPAKYLSRTGLYQLEPFRPGKIPVILVHGLSKTPADWTEAINQLRADPVIRENYQFLCFRYPSGFPAIYCGSALRHHLAEFREQKDPGRRHPRMNRMVLVGKSFGGILSSLQVRDSGEALRKLFVDRPLAKLPLPDSQRESLESMLYFRPNPDVNRVVFMATPHLGTDKADTTLANLMSRIIRYPSELVFDGPPPEFDGLTSLAQDYLAHPPSSVDNLRPHSPVLEAVRAMPLKPGLPVHSIIGKVGNGPLEESDDSLAPYWSTHLEDAVSEAVVPSKHSEIARDPGSIGELHRILRRHLVESG